jgi:hypothetical protein
LTSAPDRGQLHALAAIPAGKNVWGSGGIARRFLTSAPDRGQLQAPATSLQGKESQVAIG